MTITYINTGSSANAGNGDTLRLAFTKINSNFSELVDQLSAIEVGSTSTLVAGTYTFALSNTGTISLNGAPFVSGSGATGATGPQGAGFSDLTSTSSNSISTGTLTFTVNQTQGVESAFMGGQYVLAYAGAPGSVTGGVYGYIDYYYGNTFIVNSEEVLFGSGTTSSWYFELTGAKGINGTIGIDGATGATGPAGPTNTATTATLGGVIIGHNLAVTLAGTLSAITSVISDVAPANPIEGDQWWDSVLGRGFVYYDGLWIEMSPNVGAVGPAGATGAGATGATGVQGATGEKGATGSTGPVGATGLQGSTGQVGATGQKGATGSTGPVGATGLQGSTGQIGATGQLGATGATGYQGTTGATGPQGISLVLIGSTATVTTSTVGFGSPGQGWINTTDGDVYFWNTLTTLWENIGPIVGPAGGPGPDGATGMYGATGATGPAGDIGATGLQGATGFNGNDGATGATGPAGDIGATGLDGATGFNGNDGATGATGPDGATGLTGATGSGDLGKFVIVDDPGLAILSTTGTGYDIVIAATQGEGAQYISIPNNENAALGNNLIIGTSTATSAVRIWSDASAWTFGTDGVLTLPPDGIIKAPDNDGGTSAHIKFYAAGGEGYDDNTSSTSGDIDIVAGVDGGYDNDNTYGNFNIGNIRLKTSAFTGQPVNEWKFGWDGTLTAPGHILPDTNLAYDLGSTSSQWRSIHVGTGTIYIGGVALSVNQDNYVTVDGNPIITVNTTGNFTVQGDTNIVLGAVVISNTAPAATTPGSQWFDTVEGRTYVATGGVWLDASPTQIPSPETYLDGLAIDGTVIGTANVDGDAIVIDGGDNTKLTVSNNSVTIQVPGSLTRPYWAAEFGGITTAVTTSSLTIGTGAFYDSQGNVYVLGGVQFDTNEFFGLDSLLLKYDTNGNLLWSRTWHDDSGANCGAVNQAFAIDSNDKIYWLATAVEEGFGCWTGYMDTEGNLGLGGVAQGSLGFLDGNFAGADIACDNSGNYYLAGVFFDYVNNTQTPVVIKVDGDNGVPIWTGNIIPEDFESLPADGTYRAVTVNPATGDVWAIGDYYDGGLRAMLSKWDINGTHQWTKELVTTTGDVASAVIYNGGYVYTIVNDDPDQKAVVSKFDTDGVLIWASFLAVGAIDPIPNNFGDYSTGAYDLSFDSVGNVYVTGTIPYETELPQLWITKLDPANGEMLYSRMLATTEGSLIIDQGTLGSSLVGHRVGDIYQDTIVVTAITPSDIDDSTGTNALRVMVAQLPIDGSVTGTFDNIDIIDITSDIDSICSTGTYTVTTLVWSTGTSTAIYSTSSISVSYVTDVIGLTGETIALGSGTASGTTTTNTWTFVNNNIILPPGGDILDSYGNSVLADIYIALPSWITVVADTEHLPTLNTDYGWDSSGAWSTNATILEEEPFAGNGTSFPFRTTFSIPNDTKSVTTVDFVVNDLEESDFGITVFASGTNPTWVWEGSGSSIDAKYTPTELNGISGGAGGGEGWTPPSLGTYRARLTVDPTGPGTADITLETLTTGGTVLDTMTYTETEFFNTNYKIGFASDNDGGVNKTYFKNLTINIDNGATVYTDTLMNGNSVGGSTTALGDRLTAGSNSVILSSTGTLTLPNGSSISDGMGAIRLEPSGASSSTQALLIYPTAVDGNHIHLTAGGGETDLYLGSDIQYVKVDHSGSIVVGTVGANTSTWTFGTDGVLTLSTASTILGSSEDPNVYIETATTSTTSTWTFGTDGILTLPAATPVIKGGGTGTDVTIVASTGTNPANWTFGADGSTTFPQGSTIGETTTTTIISPPGASAGQSFVIRPTGAINTESSHIHLVSGNPTTVDLYLGDDVQYVKIEKNGGNVVIGTDNNNNHWTFGTLGDLTLPYDGGITFSDSSTQSTAWLGGGSSSLATTANNSNYFNIGNFINNGSLDINYTAFTGDYGIDFDISYQAPLDGTKGVTVGAVETPLILSTGTVILKTDISSSTSTWTFGTDGVLTIPGNIYKETDTSIVVGVPLIPITTVAINAVDYQAPFWRMFVSSNAYPNLGIDATTGTIVTTSWGDIEATVQQIQDDRVGSSQWVFYVDQDVTEYFTPGDTATFGPGAKTWTFGANGLTTFPVIDGTKTLWGAVDEDFYIKTTTTEPGNDADLEVSAADDLRLYAEYGDIDLYGNSISIHTDWANTNSDYQWVFGQDSTLTFPDETVQTTAYTGIAATATTSSTAASVGYIGMPQNSTSTNYGLLIGDMGKHVYVTSTSTVTVPSYTSVDFPIGTTIAVVAGTGASVSIAITTDTMYLAGTGTTGTRTLAAFGMATLVKVAQSTWFISGVGLT
jgi:hypothetical protein